MISHAGYLPRLVRAAAVVGVGLSVLGGASIQERSPYARAFPDRDHVYANNWPLGAIVHLAIDDPATGITPDYEQEGTAILPAPWESDLTVVEFHFADYYDLKHGDLVTVSSGNVVRQLVVPFVWLTSIDPQSDTVTGTAEPGTELQVFAQHGYRQFVNANSQGAWSANFAGLFDLQAGMEGEVQVVHDRLGDSTFFDWKTPWLIALPEGEVVEAWDFPLGSLVHLAVSDPPLDVSGVTGAASAEDPRSFVRFRLPTGVDLKPGDQVRLTAESGAAVIHTVQHLSVSERSEHADILTGTADPGAVIRAWPHAHDQDAEVETVADEQGNWWADFTGLIDLPGRSGRAQILVEGNATAVDWRVTGPYVRLFPDEELVDGFEWPQGSSVFLTVDDPLTPLWPDHVQDSIATASASEDQESYVYFSFAGVYDLKPGDVVRVWSGTFARELIVPFLQVTDVDLRRGRVAGTAVPGTRVGVCKGGVAEMVVTADSLGRWLATCGDGFPLVENTRRGVEVYMLDEFNSSALLDVRVAQP